MNRTTQRHISFTIIVLVAMMVLLKWPTGFEKQEDPTYLKVRAEVIATDNSQLEQMGIVKVGAQTLTVKILESQFKGKIVKAPNLLSGKLEMDKIFQKGDHILAVVSYDYDKILSVRAIDYYRLHLEWVMVILFAGLLIALAGWTGVQALISFGFTMVMIWKVLLPLFLKGYSPLWVSMGVVMTICGVVIFLVAGVTRKGLAAFLGAVAGVLITCVLASVYGALFKVHGAVMPYAESLLYAGYAELNLTGIFLSGIYLASSGAIMDVSMDIAASMQEVVHNRPNISRPELFKSGINVGKAVIGTMTTTLLLAYSGGFTALLMLFMAQGIPMINILNYNFVAAEILHTMIGSFGLILTAPLTALIGSFIYVVKLKPDVRQDQVAPSAIATTES